MNQPRSSPWRRVAAIAAAAGVLLLSVVGCAMTSSTQPITVQAETVVTASDTHTKPVATGSSVQSTGGDLEKRKTPTPTPRPPRKPTATPTRASPARLDGLLIIYADQLPREARETMQLIEQGGPFSYDKDGSVFQNREGVLPSRPRGYYRGIR